MNNFRDISVWKYRDNFRRYLFVYIESETGAKTLKAYGKRPNEPYRWLWTEIPESEEHASQLIQGEPPKTIQEEGLR